MQVSQTETIETVEGAKSGRYAGVVPKNQKKLNEKDKKTDKKRTWSDGL